jgi:hypothetical protein
LAEKEFLPEMRRRHGAINASKSEIGGFMTTAAAVATMKAAQVTEAGAGLRIVELEVPDPGAMIETYPLEKAAEAYARMMSGNAEFRVVLTM